MRDGAPAQPCNSGDFVRPRPARVSRGPVGARNYYIHWNYHLLGWVDDYFSPTDLKHRVGDSVLGSHRQAKSR